MHPILFELPGGAPLRSYGALVAIALLVAWIASLANAKREGLDAEKLGLAFVLAAVAGLLGARGLWLAQHPEAFEGLASVVRLTAGQLAFGGGLIAAALASWVYCRKEGIDPRRWADALAQPLLVGFCLERLGALLAGSDFGLYAPENPLAVRYPAGSPAQLFHLSTMRGSLSPAGESLPVHPTPLYAVAVAALMLGLLIVGQRRGWFSAPGQRATLAVAALIVAKMLIEPWTLARRDPLVISGVDMDLAAGVFYLLLCALVYRRLARARAPGGGTPASGARAS